VIFVLDTPFFLYGLDPSGMDGKCVISPEVRDEVLRGFPARKLGYYLEAGVVEIASPCEESLKKAGKAAILTGDSERLSVADISVIALAIELKGTIITDDYSVQNVARVLKIEYLPLKERGIKGLWEWRYRCTGCGRFFEEAYDTCPVCGSPLKTVPLGRRKSSRK